MLNKIKDYKLLILKNNGLNLKEVKLSYIIMFFCFVLFVFTSIISISFYSKELSDLISFYEIRRHSSNNKELKNTIILQKDNIDALNKELESIKDRDNNLRKLLKLPLINEDIRKLGVGGNKNSINEKDYLSYLLPELNSTVDFNEELNFIKRSINLETLSYNQIESKLEDNLDYYLHYPAIHPVSKEKSRISSTYGFRIDPYSRTKRFHEGDDFSSKIGEDVIATANGIVRTSKRNGSFGNYIEIDHGYGFITVYGHLSNRHVRKGDTVVRGQKIGEVGNTGRSTAPHLHYEVLYKNKHTNPKKYYFVVNS